MENTQTMLAFLIIQLKLDALNVKVQTWLEWIVRWELLHGYGVSYFLLLLVLALAVSASILVVIKFTSALVVEEW